MMTVEQKKLVDHLFNEIEENMSESDFQRDFYESLVDWYSKHKALTNAQLAALKRIYERVTR